MKGSKKNVKEKTKEKPQIKQNKNKSNNDEQKENNINELEPKVPLTGQKNIESNNINKINMNIQESNNNDKNNNPEKLKEDQNNIVESKINENNLFAGFPSKLELDNKAIKSIMPYFEKNMNYTKKIAKNEEKVIILYDQKIDELINIYTFTEKYLNFIIQVFTKICNPFYQILSSTYTNDIKPYFSYFKNLVNIFDTFSENLKTLGHSIKHPQKEDENNNISELMNVEFDLNKSVEKLNLIYADIFSIITNNLKENVLNKPLYNKVETVEPKFSENLTKMHKLINKIKHRREKLNNKYKKEYEPLFYYFKDRKEKQVPELFNDLVCMKDFLFIEYDLISYCNKAFVKVRKFLEDIEILFNDSTNLFCDYLETLKTMIKIYYDENRFIINPNILSKNMIENLDKLIEQDIRKKIEKKLSIKNIIEFSKDSNLRNEMNHLLLNYRDILIQSQILNEKNEIVKEITNFNLLNFKSTKHFFSFLLDLVPQIRKFNFENFIQLKLYVKRDAGVFKKWRNTILIVTYQGHILFLEESSINNSQIKESLNKENQNKDEINNIKIDKENNAIIVKDELSNGIVPNKLVHMYLSTSYGLLVTGKKEDRYLFQIWSFYNGNKKGKELNVDALNQDNLTQVINILNHNNDLNITQINK